MRPRLNGEKPKSVIDAFRDVAKAVEGDKISIDAFSKGLGRRSFGFMLLTLNLPNLIPLPLPLLSVIFGFPLGLAGLQLALGFERPWIPRFLRERGIKKEEMLFFCDQVDQRYGWFHRLIHPRLLFLTRGGAVRLIGLAISILAFVMVLPVPLGNLVLAIPIALLALGLIERDGYFVIGGLFLGVGGLFFNLLVGSTILYGMIKAYGHMFG
ncbi:MAG: exopolysaccharide biosynthesis protein [Proteobacteria bacterium]|jgi:hypothetical protein|nr:exopolysaccharide biosynthesis protein [Alphaproteobacteria bacterium]NCC04539.1 exopolysaccharide biosynthesis protein [Pseudomonadota bacterium]